MHLNDPICQNILVPLYIAKEADISRKTITSQPISTCNEDKKCGWGANLEVHYINNAIIPNYAWASKF